MKKLVINQLPVEYVRGRRVLVRIDADTEESSLGLPLDESKALSSLPTVEYLVGLGARVVIGTEVGNPRGKVVESLRLDALSSRISELLGRPVRKLDEATGRTVLRAVTEMQDGDIVLLENLGFYPGEATNDAEFAHQLADLGDVYCNDAFALAHRARASTVGITRYLRPAAAGLEFGRELMMFESVLDRPESPFLAIVAGARIEKKLPILENLAPRLNSLFIGGALSFTFITASGL